MPRTQPRITIAPGIEHDGTQYIATVRHGSARDGTQIRIRERFPLDTEIDTIRAWQLDTKADLLRDTPAPIAAGTLAADVPAYLETLADGAYKTETTRLLDHWIASPLGAMPRHAIDRLDVIAQIAQWTNKGHAAASCNKRLSKLRLLCRTLDHVITPPQTDGITYLPQPEIEPRDIPPHIVNLILDSLPDVGRAERFGKRPDRSETKIRLRVMAWTGITNETLRRLQPRHVDFVGKRIYLSKRRKGGGVAASWVGLLPPAIDALRDFAKAKLYGKKWNRSSMRNTWRRGIARAKAAAHASGNDDWIRDLEQLPPGCKPYDLRHSFATEMYRINGDIRVVAELLQHRELSTTSRYTKGAVSARVTAAVDKASAVYAAIPTLPPPVAPAPQIRLVRRARSST